MSSYTVTFVGATGGCTNACLTHFLLSNNDHLEYKAIALARTPSKLIESLKRQPGITDSILDRKLTIVQGDGTNAADIKKALFYQAQIPLPKLVDAVVSGIGSYPVRQKGTLLSLTLASPNIAQNFSIALITALREIYSERPDIETKPVVSVISTTGLPSPKEDVPFGMRTLYHHALKVPHEDKAKMEELLMSAYEKEALFKAVVIVRPTLLTGDGIILPDTNKKTVRAGTVLNPAKGYLISRGDVGEWIWANILLSDDRGGKCRKMSSKATVPGNVNEAALVRRYNVERSCLRCHERKVRCNKALPCSACTCAKVQCRYPGPERTKRRSQRGAQVQLGSRLDRLERALGAMTTIPERADPETDARLLGVTDSCGTSTSSPPPPKGLSTSSVGRSRTAPPENHPTRGLLIQDGASTRYINEAMLSQMLEKPAFTSQETELQSAISTPDSRTSVENRTPSFGFHGMISAPCVYATNYASLYPSRGQAARLWQVYLNNVNPIMRLLHIPTTQSSFFSAINDYTEVAPDFKALLFAIYFAAVTSLDDSEVNLILGQDRQSAVNAYQQGMEVNLHAASFLDSPTITSLQALSIYLMCRRSHNTGLSGWALNGLLARAAQSIGLHRDGENFKLSPFECEVRRRLWWQVAGSESRVAEDHGLFTGDLLYFCDTKLPSNLNDIDLTVDMRCPPEPKQGWTETMPYLLVFETNKALQEMQQFLARGINHNERPAHLERFLHDFKAKLSTQFFQYLDANVPVQKYVLLLGNVQLGKLEVLVRQQSIRGLTIEKAAEFVRDETLVLACEAIQRGTQLRTDELLKSFHWLTSTYPQYFLLTYSLWHLCIRPDTESADWAWNIIEQSLQKDQMYGPSNHGPKWNVMNKLRQKALTIRHSYLSRKHATTGPSETENHEVPTENLDEDIFNMAVEEGMMWDLDLNLISGFQAFSSDPLIQGQGSTL
ncbi:hypothetical protein UA08_06842 [Talaromyces atroroseus]|uniref:Zn(2)-C6 fungal-type domain-containing protein n=1 Tax=Talaromyces atroroseus TaxID=1441469 RepID=A0A225AB33_TALAT|nr:hypothetical protein UA08_06842 [Talaromyces atroroseus]OKL58231.1 hypothetical protein UA08_06842 [Talaromyces atroroseus]